MEQSYRHFPIVICGAGTVGLMLAAELAFRNQKVLLIEKSPYLNDHPRANAVANRSMEYFRRLGIAKKIQDAGIPPDSPADYYWISHFKGKLIHKLSLPASKKMANDKTDIENFPEEFTWSPYLKTITGQNELEKIILNHLYHSNNVAIKFEHELINFNEDNNKINLEIRNENEILNYSTNYLMACDGGKSLIREKLKIPLKGRANISNFISIYFRSEKFMELHDFGPANIYFPLKNDMAGFILNWDTGKTFTYHLMIDKDIDPNAVNVKEALTKVVGSKIDDLEIISVQPWNAHALVANKYQNNNIFLLGDAAHLFTPTGGFGMNTGISDAVDLAWKIEAVTSGWASRDLLKTYEEERRPIGIRNTNEAANCFDELKKVMIYGDEIDGVSKDSIQLRSDLKKELINQNKIISSSGTLLGYRYNSSAILSDGSDEPKDDPRFYIPSARPGHRAPHYWIKKNETIYDLFGPHFTFVAFSSFLENKVKPFFHQLKIPFKIVKINDVDCKVLYKKNFVLVRPDYMISWRADVIPENFDEVLKIVTCNF